MRKRNRDKSRITKTDVSRIETLVRENELYHSFAMDVFTLIKTIEMKKQAPIMMEGKYQHDDFCEGVISELYKMARENENK